MAVAMGSDENTRSHANHPAPLSNSSSSSSSSSTSSMSLELSSSVSSSMISTSTTASDKSYLRRLGSRSLTEEHSRGSTHSDSSVSDATAQRNSFPTRVPSTQATVTVMAHHGSDPILNDRHYAALRDRGDYVRMGWLTKQGHVWKNWKNRFFVLFHDGTLAYYKAKGKRRMKGCMKLNEGVVSVQFVDVRRANKPYVFQVEKGFYRMWCHCISQSEAELWVQALRGVREHKPPYFEPVLTLKEEQVGYRAVNTQLNKIFVTDERIQSMLAAFSSSVAPHDLQGTYDFIERLEDTIMNRYVGYLYSDPNVPLLSGNELLKFLRRHVEDRAFVPVAVYVYSNLNHIVAKSSRSRIAKSLKALKMIDSLKDFGVPDEVAEISSEWTMVRSIVDALDYMSLPSHKLDMVIHAGSTIIKRITEHLGSDYDVSDEILSAVFRYVLVHSSIDDLALVRALLSPIYLRHPACQNQSSLVTAFLDAIAWIEVYHQAHDEEPSMSDELSLASSRVVVSISTQDVGILFTTDGNGRGAIVHSVRKLSQAALSEVIVPGLALIGINDEPVLLMPFREICQRLRTAALPKKLTFMPEFFYYQLLSLDNEMYQYLFCLAASRGDRDSVSWFSGSQLDVNRPCSWEKTRGAQLFGCKLPDVGPIALHAAAAQGYFAMVDYLLRLGAHPNLQDKRGRCALHVLSTTTLDMVSIIEILKDNGADLNATDRQGITPLMEMARRGSLEGVTTLLALGARLDGVAWSTGYTALEYAVSVGATPVVELLLSKNADPNHLCLDGDTSLHLAAGLAHVEIIELLIKAGGNVSNLNRFSQTPAAVVVAQHAGSSTSIQECLDLLVSAGCDVGRPDILGRFLLHLAQLSNDDRIYDFLRQRFKSSEWDDEQCVDIYGCTAQDYTFDNRAGTELAHFHARDPRHMWDNQHLPQGNGSPRLHHHQHQHHHRTRSSSRSFHDLVHTLLHDVTVDLADLVAFSMFLESFSSLESLIDLLREYVSNGSTGRNVLRFVVVLLLFKLRHAKENDALQTEVFALIDRHRRLMAERGSVLLDDYKLMFERLFCLRGCPDKSPDEYTSIPIAMQQRYGLEHAQNFKTPFPHNLYVQLQPSQWAEHCTLLTHSLFCSIPVDDFVSVTNKSIPSRQYLSAKRWFQHLSAYVINAVLVEDYCEARAQVISFFLSAAECCLALRNYDTLAAILYALQSTAVQRLRRTMSCLPVETKKLLIQMQSLSDKGCREINKLMHAAASPSMPYIGLYLQSFVGLHELPVFEQGELVNGNRLRKLGELVVEILRRRSVAYELPFSKDVDMTLHVDLPYATDESRYARSLQLEPREAGAAPLGVRMMSMDPDGVDIDNEVRESIGSEGTFGIRQWFRMQKVVHRNRSRSSSQAASYEWV